MKGKVVMHMEERAEMLRHLRYVDDVLLDCPWIVTSAFMAEKMVANTFLCSLNVHRLTTLLDQTILLPLMEKVFIIQLRYKENSLKYQEWLVDCQKFKI